MEEATMLTLEDGNSYIIVDQITLENVEYYFLCSAKKPVHIKIAIEQNDILYFVEDKQLLVEVYDAFVYHMQEQLGIKEG